MAVFSGTIYSDVLKMETTLHAVLTGDMRTEHGYKPMLSGLRGKALILLHGISGCGAGWLYYTPLFRFAEQYGLRVILPDGHRSFYQDMKYGGQYFTYILEEIPYLANKLFGANIEPQNLIIAGLSMGGYGALRCAFSSPGRFAFAGAFSAPARLEAFVSSDQEAHSRFFTSERVAWFGENYRVPPSSDLFSLSTANASSLPPVFLACGRQDPFYPSNIELAQHLRMMGRSSEWFEQDGGHDWIFWEAALQRFLAFCAQHSPTQE